jgi:hypothetical protein
MISNSPQAVTSTPRGRNTLPPRETIIPGSEFTYLIRLLHFFPGEQPYNTVATTVSVVPTTQGSTANSGYVAISREVAEGLRAMLRVSSAGEVPFQGLTATNAAPVPFRILERAFVYKFLIFLYIFFT